MMLLQSNYPYRGSTVNQDSWNSVRITSSQLRKMFKKNCLKISWNKSAFIGIDNIDVLKKWKYSSKDKPTIRILMRAIQASDSRGLVFLRDKYA
jgi:hypothetical protein